MCFNQDICWGTKGSHVIYLMVNPSDEWESQGGLITCKLHKGWLVQSNFGKEIKTHKIHVYGYRPNDVSAKNMEVYWSKKQSFITNLLIGHWTTLAIHQGNGAINSKKFSSTKVVKNLWGKLTIDDYDIKFMSTLA